MDEPMLSRSFILCCGLALAFAGCASVEPGGPPKPTVMTTSLIASRLGLEPSYNFASGILVFSGTRGSVAFNPKMRGVLIGDEVYFREQSLAVHADRVEVPAGFFKECEKQFGAAPKVGGPDPVTRTPKDGPLVRVPRVVIDPGHGGRDPGATGRSGIYEKTINLDVAFRVAQRLQASGIATSMTRETDRYVNLNERPAVANRLRADLFVSIHADWNRDPSLRGATLFVCHTKYSDADRAALVAGEAGMTAAAARSRLTANRERSRQLASILRTRLSRATRAPDRGTRLGAYRVLRRSICPAVLIETGFLSNADEEEQLRRPEYRAVVAAAIADGIRAYLGRN
jgi:N-acetylmuramoyl-L-alanine amidase